VVVEPKLTEVPRETNDPLKLRYAIAGMVLSLGMGAFTGRPRRWPIRAKRALHLWIWHVRRADNCKE
jgi:hypothetical protein